MKLLRFGDFGKEKPGALLNNEMIDVSSFGEDYDEHFFETDGINRLSQCQKKNIDLPKVESGTRIGAPFKRPSKIICIGLSYTKHAFETKMPLPTEPIIFFKSTSALTGPNDGLVIPRKSNKTDWEVELAVVIGKKASYVQKKNSMDYISAIFFPNNHRLL